MLVKCPECLLSLLFCKFGDFCPVISGFSFSSAVVSAFYRPGPGLIYFVGLPDAPSDPVLPFSWFCHSLYLVPLKGLSTYFASLCVCLGCPWLPCPYLPSCLCVCLVTLVVLSLSFLLLVCLPGAPGIPVLIFPPVCVSAWCPWLLCPYLSS